MTRFLSLLLLTLAALPLCARTISGTVLSDKDSTAVIGATCRLQTSDKTLLNVMTDEAGRFQLSTEEKTALRLEVSAPGFNSTNILIENGKKNITLGIIFLNSGTELEEVTVTGKAMIDARGRTIVFPSDHEVKASSSSLSLFQKLPLPGLTANPFSRTLSVDGGSPMILINGVPSSMDDVNALQPKEIEKIEFTRLTPARYADKGTTGFLSITLKKRDDGGRLYLWGRSALNTAFMDGTLQTSYHQGPSEFTIAYSPSWRNYAQVYDNVTESLIAPDFRVDMEEHDRNPFHYFMNPFRLRYNFVPSTKTLLSVTFSGERLTSARRAIGDAADSYMGAYDYYNTQSSNSFSPSLDIFFRQDFNEKNSLEAEVTGTLNSQDYKRTNQYKYDSGENFSYPLDIDSHRRSLITELNYTHSFSDFTSLAVGYQNTISHSRNTYTTSDYEPVLTENNNYLYARLSQQIGNVYLSASTGAKFFWLKNDEVKRHFLRNRTTLLASWRISPNWQLTGQFYYMPGIPGLASLTDYYQQSTPYLFTNGNPNLKSTQTFTYQLSASYTYKKLSASLMGYVNDMHNATFSDIYYLVDGKFLSQSVNSTGNRCYVGMLQVQMSDIYGFGFNINLRLSHYYSAVEHWNTHLTNFSGAINLWWNHGPYTISYWRKLPAKTLSGYMVSQEENGDALSFEWKPNRHFSVELSWNYMFDPKGTKYPTWNYSEINPGHRERYIKNNGNMVLLSVSYNTDFGSIFRTGRRSLENKDSGSAILQR